MERNEESTVADTKKEYWRKTIERTAIGNSARSIIVIHIAVAFVISVLFFFLIPIILNYPPGSINSEFEKEVIKISYMRQYIGLFTLALLFIYIFLKIILKDIDDFNKQMNEKNTVDLNNKIDKIRKKCFNVPYMLYLFQIILPSIVMNLVYFLLGLTSFSTIKISIILFAFMTLASLISFVFSKKIFTRILVNINNTTYKDTIRLSMKKKIFLQIIPIFLVAIIFTSLVGYSILIKEKGDTLFLVYKNKLETVFGNSVVRNEEDITQLLKNVRFDNVKGTKFYISPEGDIKTNDGTVLSEFFEKYLHEVSPRYSGRIYDFYGVDTQGVYVKISSELGDWIIGVKYEIVSINLLVLYTLSFLGLTIFSIFILSYFSKSLSEDISSVANSLMEISESEDVDLDKKIPVISNDENGDLIIAFNKIQEKQKEYIEKLHNSQEILLQQDRLASLGQMIGGIAHNMKTPIMSIAGGFEGLKDLIKEYDESIGDRNVTEEDHHEIAAEMAEWVERMRPYLSYMSDIISAVKGQAVKLNESSDLTFSIQELVDRIKILMKYELNRNGCNLDIDIQIEQGAELKGEINNLVQVLNNLISNSIDSYEGNGGNIGFRIYRSDNDIEFVIKDFGKGMPEDVKERLFKEMFTTKGKKGTGLGLYMSYSAIRAKFNGSMRLESEKGKGTSFYISIPVVK